MALKLLINYIIKLLPTKLSGELETVTKLKIQ